MDHTAAQTALASSSRQCTNPTIWHLDPYSPAMSWVEAAIAGGYNPIIRQQPLSGEDAGEWMIVTLKRSGSKSCAKVPPELWDEVFMILAGLGRISFDAGLKSLARRLSCRGLLHASNGIQAMACPPCPSPGLSSVLWCLRPRWSGGRNR